MTSNPQARRFSTVLIANRGEIALRVIRAVKAAGLRTVAVYSDADHDAPHVLAADVAVHIGPAAASESYLSIPNVLSAARAASADAVHPGYGFLSERSEFARAVLEAGLVFIGPPADVMDAMGRKDRARQIAVAAGVPVIPAADLTPAKVGFPLLVKAAAGGGGKGMRIVREQQSLSDAVLAAKREAMAAFGDATMLFERYVEHGRHIEVQILADEHGHVVHLHERDCSVQRRHQKVIEEAPAVAISDSVRQLVLSSAVALAKEVGYVNAGTVEFLVSGEEAFFLEMNTRLQVEHPVTELVTGHDLVALQLSIAQGDILPFGQDGIVVRGHAIEARVYAEDPGHGFLPQAGTATLVRWPQAVRVDAALQSRQRVSSHYDPMLGKVIVWGADREVARSSLVAALDDTAIVGLTTNVGFLRDLADSDAFRDSAIDTAWLDDQPSHFFSSETPDEAGCLAAWATAKSLARKAVGPFGAVDGWRLAGPPAPMTLFLRQHSAGDGPASVDGSGPDVDLVSVDLRGGVVTRAGSSFAVRELAAELDDASMLDLEIDGARCKGLVLTDSHGQVVVSYQGRNQVFEQGDDLARHGVAAGDGSVVAPMPGIVLAINVLVGEQVLEGDPLAVMEAMKMELALKAPFSGVVTVVNVDTGARVELGATLFEVARGEEQGGLVGTSTSPQQPR